MSFVTSIRFMNKEIKGDQSFQVVNNFFQQFHLLSFIKFIANAHFE